MECFVSILKKRFMILKNPIQLNNNKQIRNVVITYFCIHNILLLNDGNDDWKELIGDDDMLRRCS